MFLSLVTFFQKSSVLLFFGVVMSVVREEEVVEEKEDETKLLCIPKSEDERPNAEGGRAKQEMLEDRERGHFRRKKKKEDIHKMETFTPYVAKYF
jgi:3-oxoacyl-(acyl-carrier-protein) synthase